MKVIRADCHPLLDADARRASEIRVAQAILGAPEVVPSHRRELLSIAVWIYTEADAVRARGLGPGSPMAIEARDWVSGCCRTGSDWVWGCHMSAWEPGCPSG